MRTSNQMAAAILLGATAFAPAMAVMPLQTTSTVTNSNVNTTAKTALRAAVNGTTTVNAGTAGPVSAGNVNITKFDTTTGILVGASVSVSNVTTSVSTRISGTPQANSNPGRTATATASNWLGSVSGVGFTAITNGTTAGATRACAPSPGTTCTAGLSQATIGTATTLSGTRTIAAASLASYAADDGSSVALHRTADGRVAITTGARVTNATNATLFSFTGGSYSLVYDYLKFSTPSFDADSQVVGNTLDFGRIAAGSGPVTLGFSLYNLAADEGADYTAGADLLSIVRSTNASVFTTNAVIFSNLVGGGSVTTYFIEYNPIVQGVYNDSFTFNFKDHAPGGIGLRETSLELTVLGATVPEPQSWAMLFAGFAMVGFAARRRRTTVAA